MKYGQTIKWTNFWNGKYKVSITGFDSLKEARQETIKEAKRMGWTSPKWWQWWRWQDTKIKE